MKTLKQQFGIGLLEVLIATGVVAFGLLAISSMQVGLLGESGNSKIRAEALMLANQKKEELRDRVTEATWTAIASGKDSLTGTNATFNRFWLVTDQAGPVRKVVEVYVTWGDTGTLAAAAGTAQAALTAVNGSATAADERVAVQTELAFQSPVDALELAASGALNTESPSPTAGSSDEIFDDKNIPLFDADDNLLPGFQVVDASKGLYSREVNGETQYVKDNGVGGGEVVFLCPDNSLGIIEFENGLFTRRVNDDLLAGKESIELFSPTGDSRSCRREIRYNGGVIIPIRGIVFSRATSGNNGPLLDVNLFTFNASESGAFCVFKPDPNSTEAPYVCYVGGNCANSPDGVHKPDGTLAATGEDTIVTECPKPAVAKTSVGPGGWRGNVGLLGVASHGNNVCFAEELAGPASTFNTARTYFTRRSNAGVSSNEGINKPYECHNFLIINGKNTPTQVANECQAKAATIRISGLKLASKFIQRPLTGTTLNTVDLTVDNSNCPGVSAPTFTLAGTFDPAVAGTPTVTITETITDGAINGNCTANATTYSCTITTNASQLTIAGTHGSKTDSCLVASSSVGCTLSLATRSSHAWTITGTISGGYRNQVEVFVNGDPCVMDHTVDPSTYECSLTTADTIVTLTATGGGVTPGSVLTELNPVTDPQTGAVSYAVEGPNFSAIIPRTISGTVSFSNQVTLQQATISVQTGTCSGITNPTGTPSYTCTVPDNVANSLTLTISPRCSTGQGSKQYEIDQGSNSSSGTGTLAVALGTVTADQTRNFSVSRSNSNCQ